MDPNGLYMAEDGNMGSVWDPDGHVCWTVAGLPFRLTRIDH